MPAFHHLDAAAPHQFVRRQRLHLGALEHDRALGDLAALGMQQIRDRLQRRGLAGAIGAEQRDDAALVDVERDALQHQDDVVVEHLDIVDGEDFLRRGCFVAEQLWTSVSPRAPLPSPLAGEGAEPLSGEAGEGFINHRSLPLTPRCRAPPLPQGERGLCKPYDDLSQGSVRFGQGWFLLT